MSIYVQEKGDDKKSPKSKTFFLYNVISYL